jgi:NAD(P)-dependent dehydrogenase (short-subunit alcohol dehydrogenase family)
VTEATSPVLGREPALVGQTVVVIGGSSGIGLETARQARAEGAQVVLTRRNLDRLQRAAEAVDALRTAAFDSIDFARLEQFFNDLPGPIDHVMVSGSGPYYAPLTEIDLEQARREELRSTLPIGRVVGPEHVAALAVHLMINTALTGATYDVNGGQQVV